MHQNKWPAPISIFHVLSCHLGVEPLRLLLLRREVVRGLLELSLGGDEPPVAAAVLTQQLGVGLLNLMLSVLFPDLRSLSPSSSSGRT